MIQSKENIYSLMATNMDANDPEEYCSELQRMDSEQALIKQSIGVLKRELKAMKAKEDLV